VFEGLEFDLAASSVLVQFEITREEILLTVRVWTFGLRYGVLALDRRYHLISRLNKRATTVL
jgi:hypothetical protein